MLKKQVTELTSKLKLVSVRDIIFEEVKGYKCKGRPKKDEEKVTVSVIVRANVQIDTEAEKIQWKRQPIMFSVPMIQSVDGP